MIFIEDLGMLPYGDPKKHNYKRFYLVQCEKCKKILKQQASWYNKNSNTSCRTCYKNTQCTSLSTFLAKAQSVHGTKYRYDKVKYVNNTTPVLIYCNYHKEYFLQKPDIHIRGSGCQKCAKLTVGGWGYSTWKKKADRSKHFTGFRLYVIECTDTVTQEKFIKIGKTYTSLEYRFKTVPYNWKLLYSIEDSDYKVICDFEKTLHKQFKHFRYAPRLPFSGKTECFTIDLKQHLYSAYLYAS